MEAPPDPMMVNADPGKLHQVLLNLTDNAIKFSERGMTIKFRIKQEGNNWHIAIVDQGVGIGPDKLPMLFERFAQADGSRARAHEGVGLGLVIARKLVEMHGGQLWLESELGKGTTAHVVLPVAPEILPAHP